MKKTMKIAVAVMLLVAMALTGCQTVEPAPTQGSTATIAPAGGDIAYSIGVVDTEDKPYTTGVVVRILQNGEQVAMQPVNAEGKVEKTLPAGEYTVELQFTGDAAGYYYDQSNLTLSAEKNTLQIQLVSALNGEPVPVYDSNGQSDAYAVQTGSYYVKLVEGRRNYFLFAPQIAGTYEITTSDPNATVGNYGYTAYIMANSISEVKDNVMTLAVTKSMVGTTGMTNPYVIGVDANGMEECILTIRRVGDPPYSIEEDEPWYVYEPTVELKKFTTPEGTIRYFNLNKPTDEYVLVFNNEDKTYHLNSADGPQILVQLAKPTQYLGALSEICTTASICKYFYDDDGNFLKRENYTKCLQIYSCTKVSTEGDRVQSAGKEVFLDLETGLYPLTEDLKYILQNHGDHAGWWDVDDPGYLFVDADGNNKMPNLNPDIAWLFLCCYVEQ